MHILIIIPTPLDSQQGNTITAQRYKRIFEELGHSTEIANTYTDQEADVLIAIHAVKSAPSLQQWKQQTNKPCVLVLGGTDIYKDQNTHPKTYKQSLTLADKIIVLESLAFKKVPKKYQQKTNIIPQSATAIKERKTKQTNLFQICIVGHLRETKNPFFTIEQIHETDLPLKIIHIGKPLEEDLSPIARNWETKDKRYTWTGNISHQESLQLIEQSNILSHPTLVDSGPSALIESLSLQTPIIASNIDGNRGILGDDYEGVFDLKHPDKFLELIEKSLHNPDFYQKLEEQCKKQSKLFTKAKEKKALKNLLISLCS